MAIVLSACGNKLEKEAALRDEGIELMESGDNEGAIEKFDKALSLSIGKVTDLEIDINYYKAAAQYKSGDFTAAADTYKALILYDKKAFEPLFLRGCIYANEGEISQAIQDFDAAVEVDPKNYQLYIQIYENLQVLGYADQATGYLSDALEISDKSADGAYYKGRIYLMLNEYDKAEELLKKAVEKDVIEAKLYLAKLYQAQDDWAAAQAILEEYATSDKVNSEAFGTLGDIEMANENYESALSYYQAGLSCENIDNYIQLYKGQIAALENLYRFSEAREVLSQYLELYPGDEAAQNEAIFLQTR